MKTFIGIDLGTSSVKLLLVNEQGKILASHSENYPIYYPQPGWSEQHPEDWFLGVDRGIAALLEGQDKNAVKGIGFGGQMHGLVVLDQDGAVIRPCILWNDGRTEKQTAYLNEVVGKQTLSAYTANIAFAGFTAPKILWLKENEPQNFAKIDKIMLPKDYLVYRMTGVHACDYSDASGMLLLDVKNKRWSEEMCRLCSVKQEWLPTLYESFEKVGTLSQKLASHWGLNQDVVVCAGAGDNAAAAIGVGAVKDGDCNISLGTSGTVFISQNVFHVDNQNALHSFAHANGKHHLMGCILSAASCNSWWMNVLNSNEYSVEQKGAEEYLGENNVYFLPYLMGERSPHNDVNAKGAFLGLRPDTTRVQMTLAVMEGVAFALRDCVEIARENGMEINRTMLCGGGAKSQLWKKIIANVLNVEVVCPKTEQGPSFGAAILAMVAVGAYQNVDMAVKAIVKEKSSIYAETELVEKYQKRYETFKVFYPALKDVYKII